MKAVTACAVGRLELAKLERDAMEAGTKRSDPFGGQVELPDESLILMAPPAGLGHILGKYLRAGNRRALYGVLSMAVRADRNIVLPGHKARPMNTLLILSQHATVTCPAGCGNVFASHMRVGIRDNPDVMTAVTGDAGRRDVQTALLQRL